MALIRDLTVADRKQIAKIFAKLADKTGDGSIREIISGSVTDTTTEGEAKEKSDVERHAEIADVFFALFKRCVAEFADDVESLFIDLLGCTKEAFEQMPFDTEMKIIEEIQNQPGVESFFTIASRLYNGARWLENVAQVVKDKLGSFFE